MKQYDVTGMSCAACSARVEKAVKDVAGVTSCSVSLLTNSMGVEGNVSDEAIVKAVKKAGYGVQLKGSGGTKKSEVTEEISTLKRRLFFSVVFLIVLMYFSMGHHMWNWPVGSFFEENYIAVGLVQMILAAIVMIINSKFFVSGFKGIINRAPNMDTLVAMGSMAAFAYSVYALFLMSEACINGNHHQAHEYMNEFYFESAAMILALITVGKTLEARAKGKTTDALKSLMELAPKTATVLREDGEVCLPASEVRIGDIFLVKPGDNIPVDGVVVEGRSAVDESALTGESIPADKGEGDRVSAATINQYGFLKCQALRVGEETTLSQIIKMVSDAAATKAPIAKVADKVSGVFVPAVIIIAIITGIVWLVAGKSVGFVLARAISVLVISCPCALGLATPVAIMVGSGLGAKRGIMFKTAVSLEETGKINVIALDKTGTITKGEPKVTDVIVEEDCSKEKLLEYVYAMEKRSEHPLARAVVQYGDENKVRELEVTDFEAVAGKGLSAVIRAEHGDVKMLGGSINFVSSKVTLSEKVKAVYNELAEEGKTPLLFVADGKYAGMVAVADVIKEDSEDAIKQLKDMGMHVVMLTGDNEKTANAIGRQAGVDQVIAGVLPQGKESIIRSLQKSGKVMMVGDGINDAPALTRADIGVAIGAGTDVAIDAADVVLVKSKLSDVPAAIRLSRSVLRNIHQNLFWAFFYNAIGIPLAAGVWIPIFGWELNPMFGAAAMSLSSFCVVSNSLRLNFVDVYNRKKDFKMRKKNRIESITEVKEMEKTMKIEGMMCGHCEASVKKALEALEQVSEAVVSHTEGTAIVKLSEEIDNEVLKKTVEDKDYKVISVE